MNIVNITMMQNYCIGSIVTDDCDNHHGNFDDYRDIHHGNFSYDCDHDHGNLIIVMIMIVILPIIVMESSKVLR